MITIHIAGRDHEVIELPDSRLLIGGLIIVPNWETLWALLPVSTLN